MLALSALLSALVHVPGYFVLDFLASEYMTARISDQPAPPVKVVRLSDAAWEQSMQQARQAQRTPGPTAKRAANKRSEPDKKKEEKKKDEAKKSKLDGQIVEVPPTADDTAPKDARFLSKYNTRVKKESVARIEERDPSKKRVTNKLQEKDVSPARPQPGAVPTKGLTVEGSGDVGEKKGRDESKKKEKKRTVIEVPEVRQQDDLELQLSELDGPGFRVKEKRGREALDGRGDRLRLELGDDIVNEPGAAGQKGSKGGKDGLPSLQSLKPTIGTIARISGSPSRDYVEGVPEGDGTFLNTKEFKYATFFYRVRDSVAAHWDDLVAREYRRRDPTGNIYGVRDRATLLTIQLAPDGRLTSVQVRNSSGVDFLDSVAVQAFKMAEPFPNPPTGIQDEDGSIRFNFQFVVMRPRGPLNLFR